MTPSNNLSKSTWCVLENDAHWDFCLQSHHHGDGFTIFKDPLSNPTVGHVDVGWHMINEMRSLKPWMIERGVSPVLSAGERTSTTHSQKIKAGTPSIRSPAPKEITAASYRCEKLLFASLHIHESGTNVRYQICTRHHSG